MRKTMLIGAAALVSLAVSADAAPQRPSRSYLVKRDGTWSRVERDGRTLDIRPAAAPRVATSAPLASAASASVPADFFLPFEAYAVGSWPEAVAIADLNSDGRNDVAVVTSAFFDPANDSQVHVFLQQADRTLRRTAQHLVGVNTDPVTIAAGDLNSDGRADLVTGTGTALVVLLQGTDGTLAAAAPLPTGASHQLTVGDLNGDGRDDVASIAWGCTGGLEVRYQDAAGSLGAPVTVPFTCGGYPEIEAGDLNADGRTDLLVRRGTGSGPTLGMLHQQPDGTLGAPVDRALTTGTDGVAIGDVDGDGRNDLTVSQARNRPESAIRTLSQLSDGTFAPPTRYDSYDIPESLVASDVDLDGRDDVVVVHGGWERFGFYRQSVGLLESEQLFTLPYASHYQPQGLAVGDVSGDGLPDVVVADYNQGLIVVRQRDTVAPTVAITNPAPSAGLYTGVVAPLRWTASDNGVVAGVTVSESTDGGATWRTPGFCGSLAASARSCSWAPAVATSQGLIRVTVVDAQGNAATATSAYSAVVPSLDLLNPLAGETWGIGSRRRLLWNSTLYAHETLQVGLSRNGSTTTYEALSFAAPNTGSFDWTVTGAATTNAHLRLQWKSPGFRQDHSPTFTIAAPTLRVTSPNTAVSWSVGTSQNLTWTHNLGTLESTRLEVSHDGGLTWSVLATVPNTTATTGSYTWTVSAPKTKKARIRAVWTSNGTVVDSSDVNFTIR